MLPTLTLSQTWEKGLTPCVDCPFHSTGGSSPGPLCRQERHPTLVVDLYAQVELFQLGIVDGAGGLE